MHSEGMSKAQSHVDLPVGFRGYDRAATDALVAKLEERGSMLQRERDDLRRRLDELTRELDEHEGRAQAVADALVTAQQIANNLRTSAEAEIEEQRREVAAAQERLNEEGSTIRTEARQEATEIVREARIRADRLIEEVVGALDAYQRDTGEFLSEGRERLVALVHDLLNRMPGSAPEHATPPADEPAEPVAPSADAQPAVEAHDELPPADAAAAA